MIFDRAFNVKREGWGKENLFPTLLDKLREHFPDGSIAIRTHLTVGEWKDATTQNRFKNRIRTASNKGFLSFVHWYGNDNDGKSDGFPSNVTDAINQMVNIINWADSEGFLDDILVQAWNEPRGINNATLFNYYEQFIIAVRTRTRYKGWIILPTNSWAHDCNGAVPYVNAMRAVDPEDKIAYSYQIYWWHSNLCGQGRGKENQNASGSRTCVNTVLTNHGYHNLRDVAKVLVTELGVHYGPNRDPTNPYPNDVEAFGHFCDIFNERQSEVVMEATSPDRGGYDFPCHQNPVVFPGQTRYGMTPQLQVFIDKMSGVSPTSTTQPPITTEPPPPMYDIEYETNTPMPLRIEGIIENYETAEIVIDVDPENFESSDLLINITDTEWPDEGSFSINGSIEQPLPQSGNAQSRDFIIPFDPASLRQGLNAIDFHYTYPQESWGYRINSLRIGIIVEPSSSCTTETTTTAPSTTSYRTTTNTTSTAPPTTTEPPQTEYATVEELNALAEVVDANSVLIAANTARIVDLENTALTHSAEIENIKIQLAEQLAMIQRIEANLTKLKNCICNNL